MIKNMSAQNLSTFCSKQTVIFILQQYNLTTNNRGGLHGKTEEGILTSFKV